MNRLYFNKKLFHPVASLLTSQSRQRYSEGTQSKGKRNTYWPRPVCGTVPGATIGNSHGHRHHSAAAPLFHTWRKWVSKQSEYRLLYRPAKPGECDGQDLGCYHKGAETKAVWYWHNDTNGSTDQNKEPRNASSLTWPFDFWQSHHNNLAWLGQTVFWTNGARKH